MLKPIFMTAACILAVMAGVKDGRVLRHAGVIADCIVVQRYTDGSALTACRAGKLQHPPDLGPKGCFEAGDTKRYEYWHCPR